jgi:glycosyltransferase involved in cell wall biosynthesis
MLWDKGAQAFVDAARRLKADDVEARFIMVGTTDPDNPAGVSAEQLEKWEEQGIVEWWGYQDDMSEIFGRSHIVCLPSSYREGVPKVLIEAASSGRPIVTTDMPGCREIVRDGENGYLVPPRDGEAVARALKRLIGDSDLRRQMGARGRERVQKEFSVEHVVQSIVEVYENVLGGRSASRCAPHDE